jgi:hypothetical protein
MLFGNEPRQMNSQPDPLGLRTYSYAPDVLAVRQSSNLYVYVMNSPLLYSDPTGMFAQNNKDKPNLGDGTKSAMNLQGKAAALAGGAMAVGGSIANKAEQAVSKVVVRTGQLHHVITKKMNDVLVNHKTLAGLFHREAPQLKVRALDKASHWGYDAWHRAYSDGLVKWLENNPFASRSEFINELNRIYSLPDMIRRFGEVIFD